VAQAMRWGKRDRKEGVGKTAAWSLKGGGQGMQVFGAHVTAVATAKGETAEWAFGV